MRNTLIGVALAVVLIVGLFAAARFGSRPAMIQSPNESQSAEQIAAEIKPGFIGEKSIGSWKFVCGPQRQLPSPPPLSGHGGDNSSGKPPANAVPAGWKVPRCRVALGLRNAKMPDQEVRITFRGFGAKRVLAVFLRFPPDELQTGDTVRFRVDRAEWPIAVNSCGSYFCLAIRSIRIAEMPALDSVRQMSLVFKPAASPNPIAVAVPANGLAPAIRAMQRIDK